MSETPFFPFWRARFGPLGRGVPHALAALQQCTLSQIEAALGRFVPVPAFQPAASPRERP